MRFGLRKIGGKICSVAKPVVTAGVVGLGAVSSFAVDLVSVDGTTGAPVYSPEAVTGPMQEGAISGINKGALIAVLFLVVGLIFYAVKRFKKG